MRISFRYIAHTLLFGLIYYAISMASLWLEHLHGSQPFWPAAGVAAALIFLGGYRYWPAILIGTMAVALSWSTPVPIFIINSAAQIGEALIFVYLLRRFNNFSGNFSNINDIPKLLAATIPAVLFSGLMGLVGFIISGTAVDTHVALSLLILVLGNFTGIITITPLILVWKRPCSCLKSHQLTVEAAIITLASAIILILAINTSNNSPLWFTFYLYMMMPFAIWATLRFYTHGATASSAFIAILVTLVNVQSYTDNALLFNEIFIKTIVVSSNMAAALIMSSVLMEWKRTQTTFLKNERLLQEQLFFSQTVMDTLGQGIFVVNLDEQMEYVNQAYAKTVGCVTDELIGQSPKKFIPEAYKSGYDEAIRLRLKGILSSYESEIQHKNGTITPVLVTGAPRWKNGRVTGAIVVNTDLTERKRAQEMIQLVVSKSPNTTLIIDQKGEIIFANDLVKQMFGYSSNELIGQPFHILVPDRVKNTHHKQEAAYRANPMTRSLGKGRILAGQHRDGHEFQAEIALSPVDTIDGNMVLATIVDITPRMRMEQKLQQREAYLRILVEQAPIGIVVADMDGIITDANPRSVALFGSPSREKTVGINVLTLPQTVAAGIGEACRNTLTSGEMVEMETWYTSTWGKRIYFFIRIVPHYDENSEQIGIIILLENMTARIQAEEAMLQLQKTESLGILASGIAHDFNNLLVAIMAQSSLALFKMDEDAPARRHVEKSTSAAKRAAELTNQLLAYSGRGRFHISHLNINTLIVENRELFAATIPKHIKLVQHLYADLPLIEADVSQIQQVIMNLIINAAEAIGANSGEIHLTTRTKTVGINDSQYGQYVTGLLDAGCYVRLEVRDTGMGMDEKTVKNIFDPFFSTKEMGHGLGLAAVLGIINGHSGALSVHSDKNGTIFNLLFPVLEEKNAASNDLIIKEVPVAKNSRRAGIVLVIDDEESVCMAVADILDIEEIKNVSAHNGRDGVALYQRKQHDIALVILDLSMPGWGGQRTLKALRTINPQITVILSSGYSEEEAVQKFDGEVPSSFLAKPYSADDLLEAVKECWPPATSKEN